MTDTLLLILCKSDNRYHFDIAKDPEEVVYMDTLENIRTSIKKGEILKNLRSGDENNYPNLFVAEVENPSLLGREHAYTDLRIVDTLKNIMKGKENA